jgi:hypothetical protein
MEKLTCSEAAKEVGKYIIKKLDKEDAEFTNRITDGTQDDGFTEFSASLELKDGRTIEAIYLQPNEDVESCQELSDLEWTIDYYRIY